jgi:uncharacterized membrane protein HdeD (DUF308 family)
VFEAMTRKWWVLLVRGVFGVLIGILALTRPGLTVLSIVLAWAVFAEADGIAALVLALTGHHPPRSRWALTIAGLVGIAAGLIALASPGFGVVVLLWIVAAWAIGRGMFQIIAALELRRIIEGEWLMIVSGLLSIVFGCVMIVQPIFGVRTLASLIGLYASAVGLLEIALSFRVRRFGLAFEQQLSTRTSAV